MSVPKLELGNQRTYVIVTLIHDEPFYFKMLQSAFSIYSLPQRGRELKESADYARITVMFLPDFVMADSVNVRS